ncbi:cytochrome c oxidase assembly factor 3 homolog, mitochondrial [Emydura macquarii macquarii]|uniref:cytochrome c oxidase assembly factor 3 homolog, mitochondrial n=1 Tax=Emydura macquarii macquarii TaxID=1129001 RepID=UPI00352A9ECC
MDSGGFVYFPPHPSRLTWSHAVSQPITGRHGPSLSDHVTFLRRASVIHTFSRLKSPGHMRPLITNQTGRASYHVGPVTNRARTIGPLAVIGQNQHVYRARDAVRTGLLPSSNMAARASRWRRHAAAARCGYDGSLLAPLTDVTWRCRARAGMAAPQKPGDSAGRSDPGLQRRLLQRPPHLRARIALTGLGIGALAVGIYGYTFYRISQERFLDELEQEVEAARARSAKTPAN